MIERFEFTQDELSETIRLLSLLRKTLSESLWADDERKLRRQIIRAIREGRLKRDAFGLNPILQGLRTAEIAVDEIGLKRDSVLSILLYYGVVTESSTLDTIKAEYGENVAHIIHGLVKVQELYKKNPVIESENFRNLLVSFSEDMRVILIMIADRVNLMRQIRDTTQKEAQRAISEEASYLYAPLAHKLGLYKLKSELEDLSLKYLEHDAYYLIKEKLNATKAARDTYIKRFVQPLDERLKAAGLRYHMKGRTKSIHSIWQKMKKQKCGFEGIYDLFAIRIIIDSPIEREKMLCWQVYSIVTDMYQPNPKRLRDWLSVPKTNGYESLHITVLGPENKWVEVQIRTERMDQVAEHGLAAHWRYKGVKSEGGIDEWLGSIRSALENNDDLQLMDQFKMDLYEDEVYVFTPKGDLIKFPKGATILDFAYHIHTNIGNTCVGGKINGKAVSFRDVLHSGDTVEILTQSNQKPKRDWLNIVKSSKAKSKIRLALKETQAKEGLMAKELLERRFKNRKIEIQESTMAHLIKKMGYKENSDFYKDVADGKLDSNLIIEQYTEVYNHQQNLPTTPRTAASADRFEFENPHEELAQGNDDVLIIDRNLKGIDYKLAKCCHPIYGDQVFGFVTVNGGITIHRSDCPNAPELRKRFGYRIVKAKWSGKGNGQYSIAIRVIGVDDIGIVSNITNIISKEEKIVMRSINIDSNDGIFKGNLVVQLDDKGKLETLLKRIRTVKGVKQVERIY
ncbi:bifunctional (p)ppGpp synthetase/guanosine-3',5'-bis(diphosphate) 3'-pyrophosphohydrolase [Prevotella sp. A2931]|uniref:Bifunctional (P)ppGpp synthetase/guanosine-3',5'-bis(Diphosphate) 3'-pyrophosphohydrolase n=1 Tax=Prevotella illustrans TaxID=2800387 RepID=A0ABS3M2H0_9BACT|nr:MULTISPECIES: RelA/SpoT family protein [Prevotella]MBO1362379.1 bifunctional (p)ppGpp synthetase/guanosine-3',5'-bis(diphosphate) 3'-pyrophosphohydrolase [Prevotella illustrans]PTL25102.1 RelA/SpoT family protein [Prevotella sp. oral taxon 820]